MFKRYYTYILTNKYNEVLYIGVTNDLARRVAEMTKEGVVEMTVGDCRHDKGIGRTFKKNFKKKRLSQEKVVYSRRE